jgi:hypothetical protein
MAFEEGGTSPLQRDPSGFRNRTARRIEKTACLGLIRTTVLIFKADVVSETPEVTYLEASMCIAKSEEKDMALAA